MARRLPAVFLSLAVLFLSTASLSIAAISFVKTIGTTSSTTTGTSLAITVPASGVAAGNRAIVTIALNPSTGTVACSDTGGNSYAVDRNVANGSGTAGVRSVILSAQVATALVSGNTITCTHPSVTARALSANEFSGLATTATLDKVASATGNNTAPSSGATTTRHERQNSDRRHRRRRSDNRNVYCGCELRNCRPRWHKRGHRSK